MVGSFAGCCARPARGHAAAALPKRVMNSRRFSLWKCIRCPSASNATDNIGLQGTSQEVRDSPLTLVEFVVRDAFPVLEPVDAAEARDIEEHAASHHLREAGASPRVQLLFKNRPTERRETCGIMPRRMTSSAISR